MTLSDIGSRFWTWNDDSFVTLADSRKQGKGVPERFFSWLLAIIMAACDNRPW
jgi:hypothetical protein